MHMVFAGELAVKLHAKDVEVETGTNGNSQKDKLLFGGFTVLDQLMTKKLVLLELNIMYQ